MVPPPGRIEREDGADRRVGDRSHMSVPRAEPGPGDDGGQPDGLLGVPQGAIITLSSRSRPCRMASVSSDRRSSDAPTMARAGITRGCPEASSPWMNVMMP
jgi:hypothetical protein